MKLLSRGKQRAHLMQDRVVWQAASLLLAYPDEGFTRRLQLADELSGHLGGRTQHLLSQTVTGLRQYETLDAAIHYVETFDLRRRATMYLTYWTAGDTRNRGREMLNFASAYRDAGVEPPAKESPDYLPVVLEFAATVDPQAGHQLLAAHRTSIDVLQKALTDAGSPYRHAVAAVCETLPAAGDPDRAQRLTESGPPAEAVGLQPFTLTVPPRRGSA
ncbi:nitrate reductase molybdenum cofactor assembly chaperone [Mycobacterium asiaticum]|uniref:Nitrate reductase molybdenum cofactor assembly chaperone n=1 Tax=Mycobacterium asiaticum TaxID=1790 RepID=A0A1A3NSB7_MYCAS|nr:nitrate reductase molybdenum cofactor assembly chaperone [Mycobacterium asiaticum]OBK24816.1 nitrate reductase molybdenum cofactor assembly chaperone [Mycobacterium asiaticum]